MKYFLFVVTLLHVFSVHAFDISVNVSGYIGRYTINNGGHNTGSKVFSLAEGTHTFAVVDGGSFNFSVSNSGQVTSFQETTALGTGTSLNLNTVMVTVDPKEYSREYSIARSRFFVGLNFISLPTDIELEFQLPQRFSIAKIVVSPEGLISRNDTKSNFILSTNKVEFKTTEVVVNPKKFQLSYGLRNGPVNPGVLSEHLINETTNRLVTRNQSTIMDISLDAFGLIPETNSSGIVTTEGVEFFTNLIKFTPPAGLMSDWFIVGGVNVSGEYNHSLFTSTNFQLQIVGGSTYAFNSGDCSSIETIATSSGDFTFECVSYPTFNFLSFDLNNFNSINSPVSLDIQDGSFSTNLSDFSLSVNNNNKPVSDAVVNPNTFEIFDVLEEGRNIISLSGKDYLGDIFVATEIVWAGSAEVTVTTDVPSTVELKIEIDDGGTVYDFTVSGDTVNNSITFNNVPQLEATITTTSVNRSSVSRKINVSSSNQIHISDFK